MGIRTSLHPLGICEKDPYEIETVVFECSVPGTYTIKPKGKGVYQAILVGAGAGGLGGRGGNWSIGCSGSSGGLSQTEISLKKKEYTFIVGAGGASCNTNDGYGYPGGDTQILMGTNIVAVGGGAKASYVICYQGGPSYATLGVVGVGITQNGNAGSSAGVGDCICTGGASVYNGYGRGGDGNRYGGGVGANGYVKLVYKRMRG